MPQLKELLVEQLQDLLHAEGQLTGALPKMAEAAHHPKLKEAFEKHLARPKAMSNACARSLRCWARRLSPSHVKP
jgi:ferritin-like metal-binding protein YciE